jgi:diguanylate cyclase (GGDEF)-like protein
MPDLAQTRHALLLVEDNPGDAELVQTWIAGQARPGEFTLAHVSHLAQALEHLQQHNCDLVLCDLGLPDSASLDTVSRIQEVTGAPLIVLSGRDDEQLDLEAVRTGVEDYLIKGRCDGYLLVRAIRRAIERHRLLAQLEAMSVQDALTGVHNRRGFIALAEKHLKLAQRAGQDLHLYYVDLDDLKQINDTMGHQCGDEALIEAAQLLRRTFRETDIIGRLGGDEFVVLALQTGTDPVDAPLRRLACNAQARNGTPHARFRLELSVGVAQFAFSQPATLDELLAAADRDMYKHKRAKCGA